MSSCLLHQVRRHLPDTRGRAGRSARAQAAGAAVPLHHPAGAGRRESAAQRRRPGGTQAQDTMARRHHAPGGEPAGVHAAAGGAVATAQAAPDPLPWGARPECQAALAGGAAGAAQG